jgi:Tol biopolymer transport system component
MRAVATAGAIATAILVQPSTSGSVHTVAQHDQWRTAFESPSASVSANGRYVAFASYARLNSGDTDDRLDVYVLDRHDGHVSLESTHQAYRESVDHRHPRLSADGQTLVYERAFPTHSEIVIRDRMRGTNTSIPEARSGTTPNDYSRDPEVSRDGRVVVFSSTATHLAGTDANGRSEDVYAYIRASGAFERISRDIHGVQLATGASLGPSVSADGRFVAFSSTSDLAHLAASARGPAGLPLPAVYVFDRTLKVTRLVSRGSSADPVNGPSWSAALSADGRYVAFVSEATNLVVDDRNHSPDVFVAELATARIELVSRTPAGSSANGRSAVPAISDNGQIVAFQSEASDMLCPRRCVPASEDINLLWDVFVFDREARTHRRLSRDAASEWMEPSVGPALDGSGSIVAFSSRHPVDTFDVKNDFDLFVWAPRPSLP